ncbi:MAG: ArnT family glycosyltransferase [Planctomycetaceae bacterium]
MSTPNQDRLDVFMESLRLIAVPCTLLAMLFLQLGESLLWDDDECRNARCSAEMLAAGDIVVPKFHGQLRTHKPVLLYWLMMPCMAILGDTELAARLPSAIGGVGSVICVWVSATRLYARGTAELAALALGSSLLFVMAGRAATPDSLLIFCITASLSAFVCGTWATCPTAERSGLRQEHTFAPTSRLRWIHIYAFMGLAVLAKGPVGAVLPVLIITSFLWLAPILSRRTPTDSFRTLAAQLLHPRRLCPLFPQMRPVTGIVTVSVVSMPWYVAVTWATNGAWLRGFLLDHNLGRALQPMEGHAGYPLLFYPLTLCVGFFPWSVLLTVIGMDFCKQCRNSPHEALPMLFGLCWTCVPVALFSLAATQLPSYITPGYPGLAIAAAPVMFRFIRGQLQVPAIWLRLAFATAAVVSAMVCAGLVIVAKIYLPGCEWLCLIPLPLLISSIALHRNIGTSRQARQAIGWCLSAALFTAGIFLLGVPAASQQRGLDDLIRNLPEGISHPVYASWGTPRASWIFYTRQNLPVFAPGSEVQAAQFLTQSADHLLIIFGDSVESVRDRLPVATRVCGTASAFPDLGRGSLCLLQHDRQNPHIHRKLILSRRPDGRRYSIEKNAGDGNRSPEL